MLVRKLKFLPLSEVRLPLLVMMAAGQGTVQWLVKATGSEGGGGSFSAHCSCLSALTPDLCSSPPSLPVQAPHKLTPSLMQRSSHILPS